MSDSKRLLVEVAVAATPCNCDEIGGLCSSCHAAHELAEAAPELLAENERLRGGGVDGQAAVADSYSTRGGRVVKPGSVRAALTKRLATAARDAGNNVTDIARLCGVSRPTVYSWLDGAPATGDRLQRLADITGHALPDSQKQQELIDLLTGKRSGPGEGE